jgi:putative ABC transport system ATP-binding protein
MSAAAPLLDMRNLSHTYGSGETAVQALSYVNLTVAPGEMVSIMGTSGSGKSTLLAMAGGLEQPTVGDVLLSGTSLVGASAAALARLRRRSVGYVFQDLNLIPVLTALENVALPLELDGWRTRRAARAAKDALHVLELDGLSNRYPDDLSGGQQQRVAIARAVVGERRLILADEPTGALDSATAETIVRVLRGRADAGAGVVLVTHDARLAAWADRVLFLRDGRLVDETRSDIASLASRGV